MENEPNDATQSRATSRKEIWQGIGLLAALHVLFVLLCLGATMARIGGDYAGLGVAAFIGFTQFVYVIPAVIIAKLMNRTGLIKGLLIGAALTFSLTGTCALLFKLGVLA